MVIIHSFLLQDLTNGSRLDQKIMQRKTYSSAFLKRGWKNTKLWESRKFTDPLIIYLQD